jgi:hypothetical protein
MAKNDWGTEEERREDARRAIHQAFANGLKVETIDSSLQLAIIGSTKPVDIKFYQYQLDALDELVDS